MRTRSLALLILLSTAVACTPSRRFDQIEAPSYWYSRDDGVCGQTLVVDREGSVWGEGGCETSPTDLKKRRELSPTELKILVHAFDGLPASKPFRTCKGVEHQFRRVQGTSEEAWAVCVPNDKHKTPLPAPYEKLRQAFGK